MKTYSFDEMFAKLSPERRAAIEARFKEFLEGIEQPMNVPAAALAACPFCGHIGISGELPTGFRSYHAAECEDCGAEGPTAKTHDEAVIRWNTRA